MHKNILTVVGITILFLGTLIALSVADDTVKKTTIHNSNGKTLYVGGTEEGNYSSIQDAIDDASDEDTVFVYDDSSPYYENVIIDKTVSLIGENRNSTNIDGGGFGTVVNITVDNVNLSGFTIQNSGDDLWYDSGIEIHSSNNTVEHNIIINNRVGVNFGHDKHYNNKVLNNTIKSNSVHGIFAWPYPDCCKNLTIVGNEITYNEYAGMALLRRCEYSNISHNTISYNKHEGINMQGRSNNSLISNNIITYNEFFGLWLCESYRCTIRYNYFEKNGWEISFWGDSNHSIYHNNIIDGTNNECYDEGTSCWDNGYPSAGNYWNSYDGVDFFLGPNQDIPGIDGIGDTPYFIPGGDNQDRYPLMEPYGMTKLSISIRTELFSFSGDIKNIGDKIALNVQRRIKIEGGFVLLGRITHGVLSEPLLPGEETRISPGSIFGLGRIKITIEVWADNAPMISVSKPGFLILFFILIK